MTIGDVEVGRVALRTFHVSRQPPDWKLYIKAVSQSGDYWKNGICAAECLNNKDHRPPDEGCSCGIYGTLDLGSLMRQYALEASRLIAVIAAEGHTIIGPVGLRTERAKVVAYWTPKNNILDDFAAALPSADHYPHIQEMLAVYNLPEGVLQPDDMLALDIPVTQKRIEQWGTGTYASTTYLTATSTYLTAAWAPSALASSYATQSTIWLTGSTTVEPASPAPEKP